MGGWTRPPEHTSGGGGTAPPGCTRGGPGARPFPWLRRGEGEGKVGEVPAFTSAAVSGTPQGDSGAQRPRPHPHGEEDGRGHEGTNRPSDHGGGLGREA